MKKKQLLLLILAVWAGAGASAQPAGARIDRQKVENAVRRQLHDYPASRLQDLYKSFFQDYFGPGHMISDTAAADRYLRDELATVAECTGPLVEPTGGEGNFYRVGLCVLKEKKVAYRDFLHAFIASAHLTTPPSLTEWSAIWQEIQRLIDALSLPLPDYEADRDALAQRLSSGRPAVHHSAAYNRHYAPHYRIISKSLLKDLKIEGWKD
jgi:hypothetical protein